LSKKLLFLDLALLALAALAASELRDKWLEARKRERVVLGKSIAPLPPPPYAPLARIEPLVAADYGDVAQKMLFSADRNPTVVVEVAPPKPMPPLPLVYGVMDLGDGPAAIMAVKANQPTSEVRPGQEIGGFTLIEIGRDELVLEWDGKRVTKRIVDLLAKAAPPSAAGPADAPAARRSEVAPSPARTSGPGKDIGGGYKACVTGDDAPSGTIRDGMKKIMAPTPMGMHCHWEPVK
jgi:hypothetical protein